MPPESARAASPLGELALLFLRLGATAFGGPAAHIALMQDEVVKRRAWLTQEEFLDLLGATNLIPGPNSTELAIHIGHRRAGWPGLLVAGMAFILPAVVIVSVIAWAYVQWGTLPAVEGILAGVKPVILAVVVQALWGLSRTALKSWPLATGAVAAAALNVAGINELIVLFGLGLLSAVWPKVGAAPPAAGMALFPWKGMPVLGAAGVAAAAVPFTTGGLFLFFLKVGSVLFGSGYVLLAFLRADLVERLGWLTEAQLLDAVLVGQVTPGPVFTTATFIGWILDGPWGAAVATAGIFLPAFFFVAISGPLIPLLRRSPVMGAFLDGVNAASVALMAVVAWYLARSAVVNWVSAVIGIIAAVLLIRWRVNSTWLILGGALAGWLGLFWG